MRRAREGRVVKPPLLSVVMPIYNEEKNIEEIVRRVSIVPIEKEMILVDDCSTDRTAEIIASRIVPKYPNIIFMRHEKNRGKGAAVRTGYSVVRGEIAIVQDADLEYNPSEYPELIQPILEGQTQVVFGSRFMKVDKFLFVWHWFLSRFLGRHYEIRYLHHFLGIQILNALANVLYGARITDEATCYKVVKTSLLNDIKLRCDGFNFCPELTAKLRKKGHRILEVPITYHPRTKKEGKKLNWKHGFEAIWTLLKYRFVD